MSGILRDLADTQRSARRHATPCQRCQRPIYQFERHCPFCGHLNQHFDGGAFRRLARTEWRQSLVDCEDKTTHDMEALYARHWVFDHPRSGTIRFYSVCGSELPRRHQT